MRKTISREWAYTLEKFSRLPESSRWISRYRVSYLVQYINLKTFNRIAYNFLLNIYLFFIHACSIFKGSVFQRTYQMQAGKVVFFLSQNITYLQHVVPIIEEYEREGIGHIILCPGAEYRAVYDFLIKTKADAGKLIRIENVGKRDPLIIFHLLLFPLLFIADYRKLSRLRLKNIGLIPADFAKFSLVRHIYEKRIVSWLKNIKALITANDHWMWESLLHDNAKAMGIQNYVVQHGLFGDVFYPLTGSHICVWGEFYRRKLIDEMGADESEVLITGSGYFDKLYNEYRNKKVKKKYITFMSQPFAKTPLRMGPGIYEQTVTWLNSLHPMVKKHGYQLIIKLHPRDRAEFYPQLKNCTFTKESLGEILSQTKLALTVNSTSILESSLLDVPVIQLFNPLFSQFLDLSTSGLSITVSSEKQMLEMVERLLSDEAFFNQTVERTREGQKHHFHHLGDSLKYFNDSLNRKR